MRIAQIFFIRVVLAGCMSWIISSAVHADAAEAPSASKKSASASTATNPLWRSGKIKNYLPDMRWPEVQALLERSDMVIIPVAALEQHGLSGPIGTDFYNALAISQLVAQKTDILVAPILLPGNSPYHMGFPGTITLPVELIEKVYFEAAKSLMHHGFKRFVFYNGHGGNEATTRFIVDRINQETGGEAVELNEAAGPFIKSSGGEPKVFDQHAGVHETSESLYLTPDLVDLSAARKPVLSYPPFLSAMVPQVVAGDETARLVFFAETFKAKETGKQTSTRELTDTGSWTELDPRSATAAEGKQNTDQFVDAAVAFINKWKSLESYHPKN
jgi:creatinine amidohydrolase